MHHGELLLLAVELDLQNLVLQSVRTLLGNVGDGSASTRWEGDQMVGDQAVLIDSTISITSSNVVADLYVAIEFEICYNSASFFHTCPIMFSGINTLVP